MIRFKEFLVETDTGKAKEMEELIVAACNGEEALDKFQPTKLKPEKEAKEAGKRIADYLRDIENLKGEAKMPNSTYPASSIWNEHYESAAEKLPAGMTLTPKTDFLIGEKNKISLKTGGARLMSGNKGEANATFEVAMSKSGTTDEAVKVLGEHIKKLLARGNLMDIMDPVTGERGIRGGKKTLKKSGKWELIDAKSLVKKADKTHYDFKKDLKNIFNKYENFANEFTFEAMTGAVKFDKSDGTANYFLVTDFEGKNKTLHKVISSKNKYVGKIAKEVNPDVSFKSGSISGQDKSLKSAEKYYSFSSVVGLTVGMLDEEHEKLVEEIIQKGDLLTEGLMQNLFNKFYVRVTKWITKTLAKVKAYIGDSWARLLQFANLKPVIRFNNNVSW